MPAQRKKPQDRLAPVEAEGTDEPFPFTGKDGKQYELPPFSTIPSGVIRRLRKEGEDEQLYGLLEAVADEETLAATDELSLVELGRLFRDWQQHAGITLPQS